MKEEKLPKWAKKLDRKIKVNAMEKIKGQKL